MAPANPRRWWYGRAHRVLTDEMPAPPEDVRAFYTDLNNIKSVHPLVISVRATTRKQTPDGSQRNWRVTDRIPLGPFILRTSYAVQMTVTATGDVTAEARQFPGVRLRTVVTFEPTDRGTRVTERCVIEAPRPLAAVTTREAVKAHTEMLAGIRRHFERYDSSGDDSCPCS